MTKTTQDARTPICFVVDENYLPPAVAQATDILATETAFSVHVFLESPRLPQWAEHIPAGITVHHNALSQWISKELPETDKWPRVVYGRLFIPQILDAPRIIYIDADIARARDLSVLNRIDMGEHVVAAVQDCGMIGPRAPGIALPTQEWQKRIGIMTGRYFNSGVMMMNANLWRQLDFPRALHSFFETYGADTHIPDQDFINYLLQDRWLELSPALNYQMALTGYGFESVFTPRFIHFTDKVKPWHDSTGLWSDAIRDHYARLYIQAGCPEKLTPNGKPGRSQSAKHWLNSSLYRLGIETPRLRKVKQRWQQKRDEYLAYYLDRIRQAPFPDQVISEQALMASHGAPVFDGNSYRAPFQAFAAD